MDLATATWTDAAGADPDCVLLPVGSTEQHGPHAPLGTDALTAEAIAEAGAQAHEDEVVVAPTVPVGVSEEHRAFAGTLWVSPDTLRSTVREVAGSLAHHGWERLVVVNGHGGNAPALREATAAVTREGEVYAVPFTWFEAVDDEMGHAGPLETALLRRHHPDLVREDRVEDATAGGSGRWGEWVAGVNLAYDTAEFTENGVVGDPARGDAELGRDLTERAGGALAEVIAAVVER
ncbi:MAG: creatininase family protein [Halobacteriales archaeon]